MGRGDLVVNTSDSGSRGRGFKPHSGRRVVSLSKTYLPPKSTGNTQEAVAPSNMTEKLFTGTLSIKPNETKPLILKPLGKSKPNFMCPWEGRTKVCMNGPGHMTKMAATLRHFHSREINDTSFGQCVIATPIGTAGASGALL